MSLDLDSTTKGLYRIEWWATSTLDGHKTFGVWGFTVEGDPTCPEAQPTAEPSQSAPGPTPTNTAGAKPKGTTNSGSGSGAKDPDLAPNNPQDSGAKQVAAPGGQAQPPSAFGTGLAAPSDFAAFQSFAGPGFWVIAANFIFYLGLALVLGSGAFLLWPSGVRPIVWSRVGFVMTAAGAFGVASVRRADLGMPWGEFAGTPIGRAAVGRLLAVGLVAFGVALAGSNSRRRIASLVLLAAGAFGSLAHANGSHATVGENAGPTIAVHALHVFAIATWIGGLVVLLSAIGDKQVDRKTVVNKFSQAAGVLIVVGAGTGVTRALQEVGSLSALVETTYGRLVLLKSELLIAIAAFGAHNRFVEVPRISRSLRGLRKFASLEVALAGAIFVSSAVLGGTEPAREALVAARKAEQPRIETQAFGDGTIILRILFPKGEELQTYLDPPKAGRSDLHLTWFGPDGQEMPIQGTTLRLNLNQTQLRPTGKWFSPGHQVVPVRLRAGTWSATSIATPVGGSPLSASFELTVYP